MSARLIDLALLIGAFLATTLAATVLGADNTGVAMAFGQIAFALTLVAILLRR